MLTENDLNQIRNIVGEEVDTRLEKKLGEKLTPIKEDITTMKGNITSMQGTTMVMQKTITTMQKTMIAMNKKLNQTARDLSYVIKTFDMRISRNESDIKEVKHHIGIA